MIDSHVTREVDDLFGFGAFGRALARAIAGTKDPEGTVIGLSGPWGAGKTSIIETYIVPELGRRNDQDGPAIEVVRFDPWAVIEGRDPLLEFLSCLQSALPQSIRGKAQAVLARIVRHAVPFLRDAGSSAVAAVTLPLGPFAEAGRTIAARAITSVADRAMQMLADKPLGETVSELRQVLAESSTRIVFVIDDLDRLPPDELLLVFRTLRTIGRLPNVVHLLAIDRDVAERVVNERFPAEGARYLDKIVQVWFEVPTPDRDTMAHAALTGLAKVAELEPIKREELSRDRVFTDAVLPFLNTPRDLKRLLGALALVWPALRDEVHILDLAALEAIKLARIETYRAIRRAEPWLFGTDPTYRHGRSPTPEEIDRLFAVPSGEQTEASIRRALAALFPSKVARAVDAPFVEREGARDEHFRERRVCAPEHFRAYFRLAVAENVLRANERADLLSALGNPARLGDILKRAAGIAGTSGGTRAPEYMREIMVHADRLDRETAARLVEALFSVADDIDLPDDDYLPIREWSNTLLWLHKLLAALRRVHGPEALGCWMSQATSGSGPRWAIQVAGWCWQEHNLGQQPEAKPADEPLVSKEAAAEIVQLGLQRFEAAVQDGSLWRSPRRLHPSLYIWSRLRGDGGAAAREATRPLMDTPAGVILLAKAFTGDAIEVSGDVERRSPMLRKNADLVLIDWDMLRSRVADLLAESTLTDQAKHILDRCDAAFRSADTVQHRSEASEGEPEALT